MAKERKSCLSKRVSRRFVNGLILLVPVVITLLVVSEVLHFTEGVLGKHLPFYFPGLGIITVVLVIYFVGWISSYWIMRRLIHYGEALLGKIPVVKFIYNIAQDRRITYCRYCFVNRVFCKTGLIEICSSMHYINADINEAKIRI